MSSNDSARSSGELLRHATDSLSTLLQRELKLGQQELTDELRQAAPGGAMLLAAGVLTAASAGASTVLVIRLLERELPRPAAAAVAAAGLGGAAALLAAGGIAQLRRVNPVPERTIRSIRDDIEAVTDATDREQ